MSSTLRVVRRTFSIAWAVSPFHWRTLSPTLHPSHSVTLPSILTVSHKPRTFIWACLTQDIGVIVPIDTIENLPNHAAFDASVEAAFSQVRER